MADIIKRWPAWFRRRYGGDWPTDYCSIDTETTGFNRTKDVIWEWSHCLVQDCKPIDRLQLIIDWTNHPIVSDRWLRERLNTLRQGMEINGRISHITYERMQDEGVRPEKALKWITEFTRSIQSKKIPFVAHGGIFDEEMLDNLLDDGFSFGDDGWIDTESIEKASQVPMDERVQPLKTDTLRSYWLRIKHARLKIGENNVKSSLDTYCFNKYDFPNTFGIKQEDLHNGYVDCFVGHKLMEIYRPIAEGRAPTIDMAIADMAFGKAKRAKKPVAETKTLPSPTQPSGQRIRKQRNN